MTGDELKEARTREGLSQAAMAERLGLTQQQVSTYEAAGPEWIPARHRTVKRLREILAENRTAARSGERSHGR